jgi:hypothetical protein
VPTGLIYDEGLTDPVQREALRVLLYDNWHLGLISLNEARARFALAPWPLETWCGIRPDERNPIGRMPPYTMPARHRTTLIADLGEIPA